MVPSQLITVVTPSSSYGFPLCPNPVTVAVLCFGLAPVAPRFKENNLRGVSIDPANTPTLPRKLRRFHFELSRINQLLFLLTGDSGDAIDFYQRVSRQRSDCDGCPRWATMRKICREHFVHSVPVLNFCQVDVRLNNGVRGSAANLHHLLDLIHDHGGVRFNRPFLGVSCVVGALPRDIYQPVVNNHWHDDVFFAAGLSFGIHLADCARIRRHRILSGRILAAGSLGGGALNQDAAGGAQTRQHSSDPSGKCPARDTGIHKILLYRSAPRIYCDPLYPSLR